MANSLWQWVSGTMSKGLLEFSGDTAQPTLLTHAACLGSRKGWHSRDLTYNLPPGRASNLRVWQTWHFISAALTCNTQQRKEWLQYKHLLFKVESVHVLQKQTCIAQRNSKSVYQEECELRPRLLVSKYPEVVFTILSCYLAVPRFLDL